MAAKLIQLATILTVRNGSTRLPHKAMRLIESQPVVAWIIKRLLPLPGQIIVATTEEPEDDEIEAIGSTLNVPVYRGSTANVVSRMDEAIAKYYPAAEYVLRALGDCPFLELSFVERALQVMDKQHAEAFLWHLSPEVWPVYGSREFPFARHGWDRIVAQATDEEREHTDLYFHRHRADFKIVYHQPPSSLFFRAYRLEIDWLEDFEFVQAIAAQVGMDADLRAVIHLLDSDDSLTRINRERVEKTGPLTSYDYTQRRAWMKAMLGQPVVGWDDLVWFPPDEHATPVFCNSGKCLLGYGDKGILYTRAGDRIAGNAYKACPCGAGRYWEAPKERHQH